MNFKLVRVILFSLWGTISLAPSLTEAACVDSPAGIIGWWRGEDDAYDVVAGNHGFLQGGVGFDAGKVGRAFRFDGTNDLIQMPYSTLFDGGEQITIEFWMKADSDNSMANCCQGLVANDRYEVGVGGGGPQQVGINAFIATAGGPAGTTGDANSGGFPVTPDQWHHIAFTYDGMLLQLYLDGQPVGNPMALGGPIAHMSNGSFLSFGSSDGVKSCGNCFHTRYFKGLLDEVAIYNRALQPYEIAAIYNADTEGKCLPVPSLFTTPTNQTVYVGGKAVFAAAVIGANPISFQWQLDGTNLPGATSAILTLTNVQVSQAGPYRLLATNLQGSVQADALLTVLVPPPCVPTVAGLVSWWRAEDNGYDQLGNNSGTMQGGAGFEDVPLGRAFSFTGSGSHVRIPRSNSLVITNSFTIEFWMKAGASNLMTSCCQGLVTTDFYGVTIGGGGPQQVGVMAFIRTVVGGDATTGDANGGGFPLTPDQWHHVAATYDSTKLQLYIDGVAAGNPMLRNGPLQPMQANSFLAIGSESGRASCSSCANSRFFKGLIDEVGLYNRALTSNEVAAVYGAGVAGKCVIDLAPAFTVQPTNRDVTLGSNVTLVAVANGTPPLSYQWRFNGGPILNATNTALSFTNTQPSRSGIYSVEVTNAVGSAVSSNAVLRVLALFATGNGLPLTNASHSFGGPVTIQIQSVFTNGSLFYTLNGNPPNFLSTPYSGSFVISNSVTLRALGYSANFLESSELDPISILLPPSYPLQSGTAGGGSVTFNPPGGTYLSNTTVTVTATPNAGWTFLQWLGDVTGSNNPASVVMNRPKRVQAVFGTTLDVTAAGNGTVTKLPASLLYPYGTIVTLVPVPQSGSYFGIWGNAANGTGSVNPLYWPVTNASQTISSLFVPLGGGQAAITVIPNGFGRVTTSPSGNAYAIGANITLTATPDAGQSFLGWSGDATGSSNPLNVSLTTSKVITANFTAQPRLTIAPPLDGLFPEGLRFTLNGEFGRNYQIEGSSNGMVWPAIGLVTNSYDRVQMLVPGTNAPVQLIRALRLP